MQKNTALSDLIGLADSVERSWSLSENAPLEERFLLFFDQIDQRVAAISTCAAALGAPDSLLARWQDGFAGADAVGLAVNRAGTSVRLYLQYWDRLVARVQAGNMAPDLLYLGLKILPGGVLREDPYICTPMHDGFWPHVTTALARIGVDIDLARQALANLTPDTCIFTETEAMGRKSWLATVRRADPDRGLFATAMAALPAPLRTSAAQHDLLHIAGGQDAIKGNFTTLYFSTTPDIARKTLVS